MSKPMSWVGAALLASLVPLAAVAEEHTVLLMSAASLQGIAPFFSDVRVRNNSVDHDLTVTATYRCFIGACPATPPQATLDMRARQTLALDDIVNQTFQAPNTGGAITFTHEGVANQLTVTSRLYSTAPVPTVGMFVGGLTDPQGSISNVLTSVRNGGDGAGFRTNIGIYNPNDAPEDVMISLNDGDEPIGLFVFRTVAPHSGVQINDIFEAFGEGDVATQNGIVQVFSHNPVLTYAAVVDNNTQDPYYVVGADGFIPGVASIRQKP